jgi:putative hydrolase of the HAD superfamily
VTVSYTAVFFDAGETLVHPHPTFPDLLSKVLIREGHDVQPETIREHVHVVSDRFAQAAETNELWTTTPERSRAFWHDVYGIFFREFGISEGNGLIDVIYAEFTDLANYRLFEDVVPVLRRLKDAGMRLGVISNFEEWLERLLDQLGVTTFFDVRVISGVVGMEKPDPRIFELAMARAGVDAAGSVYVGDDPQMDVEPAAALGMLPILIDRRERFPHATGTRITSMGELPGVLGL